MDEHFGYFSFLIIMNNSAVNIHEQGFFFLKHLFSVFLDEYQEKELVDHMVILCLF